MEYNINNINFDILLDYVFKNLPLDKESALEDFLYEDEYYSGVVGSIMDFCLYHGYNRQQLEAVMAQKKETFKLSFQKYFADMEIEPKTPILEKAKNVITYSIQQLQLFFEKNFEKENDISLSFDTYQSSEPQTNKALKIKSPEQGADYNEGFHIELEEAIFGDLNVYIEDAQEEEGLEKTFSAPPYLIEVEDLHPGRYYLRLEVEGYFPYLSYFFIEKHLMPEN